MPDTLPRGDAQEEAIAKILHQVEERLRQELKIGGQTLDQIEDQRRSKTRARRSGSRSRGSFKKKA